MNSTTMGMMQIGHPKYKHGETTTLLEWLLDVRATVQSRRTMEGTHQPQWTKCVHRGVDFLLGYLSHNITQHVQYVLKFGNKVVGPLTLH